jgi:hypothetical protein
MGLYDKFCAWLSGWPESSKVGRDDHEKDFLFAEEEKKIKENTENIGKKLDAVNKKIKSLNPKKNRQKARTARGSTKG